MEFQPLYAKVKTGVLHPHGTRILGTKDVGTRVSVVSETPLGQVIPILEFDPTMTRNADKAYGAGTTERLAQIVADALNAATMPKEPDIEAEPETLPQTVTTDELYALIDRYAGVNEREELKQQALGAGSVSFVVNCETIYYHYRFERKVWRGYSRAHKR